MTIARIAATLQALMGLLMLTIHLNNGLAPFPFLVSAGLGLGLLASSRQKCGVQDEAPRPVRPKPRLSIKVRVACTLITLVISLAIGGLIAAHTDTVPFPFSATALLSVLGIGSAIGLARGAAWGAHLMKTSLIATAILLGLMVLLLVVLGRTMLEDGYSMLDLMNEFFSFVGVYILAAHVVVTPILLTNRSLRNATGYGLCRG